MRRVTTKSGFFLALICAGSLAAMAPITLASAHNGYHRNGIGHDADGDSNPATNATLIESKIGDAAEAAYDPPFEVITFEPPPAAHNVKIRKQYKDEHGVTFSRGLNWQICEGQRYFEYDTKCTYLRAPSGSFAAVYEDEFNRPLRIRFENPVCAAALAIYPAGGEEGEEFELTLQPFDADENELKVAKIKFKWTNDTFRWRLGAIAYFVNEPASRVDVSIKSKKKGNTKNPVRFLIDDLAYILNTDPDAEPNAPIVDNRCDEILRKIEAEIMDDAPDEGDDEDNDEGETDIDDEDGDDSADEG